MYKIFCASSLTFIITLSILPFFSYAETLPKPPTTFPTGEFTKVLEVGVTQIKLDNTEVKAGDTLSGTIVLYSSSEQVVPDLTIIGSIVSGYKDLHFSSVIDKQTIQTGVSSKVGVMQEIPFTYKLPISGLSDNNGLYVEVLTKNGDRLGYNGIPLKISGLSSFVKIARTWVQVGKNIFFLQQGPSVRSGDKAFLHLEIKSIENIKATPEISLYNFEVVNDPLKKFNLNSISISSKGTTTLDVPIDISDLKPGVYVGQMSLFDDKNVPVSEKIEYRFIVWGDIATIRNITTDKSFGNKNDVVNIDVSVIGSPTDVVTKEYREFKNASLELKLSNSKGGIVSEKTIHFDLSTSTNNFFKGIIPMKLTSHSSELNLSAVLKDSAGNILDTSTTNLGKDNGQGLPESDNGFLSALVLIGSLVILIIVYLLMWRKNNK